MPETTFYAIRVRGHLNPTWAERFAGLHLTPEAGGHTTLAGPVADQAALHGILHQIANLGLDLVSINPVHAD